VKSRVFYFPAYEIITGPQAPEHFFEADRRNVLMAAVETATQSFVAACDAKERRDKPDMLASTQSSAMCLSGTLGDLECGEVAQASWTRSAEAERRFLRVICSNWAELM